MINRPLAHKNIIRSLNNVIDETVTFGSAYTIRSEEDVNFQRVGKIAYLNFVLYGTNITHSSVLGIVSALPRKRAFVNAQIQSATVPGRLNGTVAIEPDGTISFFHSTENVTQITASLTYVCK